MPTYNYVSNNPAVSSLINNQIYTVLFETINGGPSTLYFTPADTPVTPIYSLQEQPLTGGELDGAMQLVFVESGPYFILLGASPVIAPNLSILYEIN